jgi:hypothetical protein
MPRRCAGQQVVSEDGEVLYSTSTCVIDRPTCEQAAAAPIIRKFPREPFFFAGMSSGTGERLRWLPDCVILKISGESEEITE